MKTWIHHAALVVGTLALCVATVRAEDLASIEKEIIKKWQKHRSMKAKVTQQETMNAKKGKATQHGEGSYEFMRKGGELLFRSEMKSSMEVEAGGQKMKFELNTLTVCDGKYVYTLSDRVGMKTVVKARPDPRSDADLKAFLESLRAQNNLKLLDEQGVDGHDAYAIEATPKSARPGRPYSNVVYYFSKDHGFLLKEEGRDKDGKAVQTKSYTDLEFDVDIDPKRFEFKPPEGVIVQDLTGD